MIQRASPLIVLLLIACGEPQPVPGPEAAVTADSLDFGTLRRYGPEATVELTISNLGPVALEVTGMDLPEGVSASQTAFTVPAAPGSQSVTLTLATDAARVIDGGLVIHTNDPVAPDHDGPITGEVTPYIRTTLEEHAELDAYLEAQMTADELVGLGVAVVRGQDIIYLRGFGFEDQEAGTDVDPEATLFRWASLSKGITGLASMIAVDAGDLDLDEDVTTYYSGYAVPDEYLDGCEDSSCVTALDPADRRVTMRMLLSHTAGMQHYSNGLVDPVPDTVLTGDPAQNMGFAWALAFWVNAPLVAVPGTSYSYSTFGINLAGAVLETAVDTPFAAYVDTNISSVLEMDTMRPDYAWERDRRRAVGYWQNSSGSIGRDSDTDVSWKLPAGGFLSTVADLARYCGGIMGDVVLPPTLRDEMWTAQPPADSYGLGFGVSATRVSHTGAQEKTRTAMRVRTDEDLCFVMMTNSTWAAPGTIARGMDDAFVE